MGAAEGGVRGDDGGRRGKEGTNRKGPLSSIVKVEDASCRHIINPPNLPPSSPCIFPFPTPPPLQIALGHYSDVCALFAPSAFSPEGSRGTDPSAALDLHLGGWQASSPVFASIAAPCCAELLLTVAEAIGREAALRERICGMLRPAAAAGMGAGSASASAGAAASPLLAALHSAGCVPQVVSWSESGGDGGGPSPAAAGPLGAVGGARGGGNQQRLRSLLTCYLSCWLSSPLLDEERCKAALEGLAEDMAGS